MVVCWITRIANFLDKQVFLYHKDPTFAPVIGGETYRGEKREICIEPGQVTVAEWFIIPWLGHGELIVDVDFPLKVTVGPRMDDEENKDWLQVIDTHGVAFYDMWQELGSRNMFILNEAQINFSLIFSHTMEAETASLNASTIRFVRDGLTSLVGVGVEDKLTYPGFGINLRPEEVDQTNCCQETQFQCVAARKSMGTCDNENKSENATAPQKDEVCWTSVAPARAADSDLRSQPSQPSSRSSQSQVIDTPAYREKQSSTTEREIRSAEDRIVIQHDNLATETRRQINDAAFSTVEVQVGPQQHYQCPSDSKKLGHREIQGWVAKGGLPADDIWHLQKECSGDVEMIEKKSSPEKCYQFSSCSNGLSQAEVQSLMAKGRLGADEIRRLQKECSNEVENDEEAGPETQYQFSNGTKQLSHSEIQGLLVKGRISADEIRRLHRCCTADSPMKAGPMKGYQFSSGNAKQLSAKEIEASLANGYLDSKEVRRLREELKRLQMTCN